MSEKRITLNQIWKNCLRMWKWIDKVWDKKNNVEVFILKKIWLNKWMPDINLNSDCFFCEWSIQNKKKGDTYCTHCPGKLVSRSFECQWASYHYADHPKKFYKKLLELDAKRKVKK